MVIGWVRNNGTKAGVGENIAKHNTTKQNKKNQGH